MKEVSIIGVDLAKQVLQLHGATTEGEAVVFRKNLIAPKFVKPYVSNQKNDMAVTERA